MAKKRSGGWKSSTRRQRLPADWARRRARVLKRDGYQCTWIEGDRRCPHKATDVDHIIPNDDDSESNLASLCGPHHGHKTGREGAAAKPKRRRPPERHPGIIT